VGVAELLAAHSGTPSAASYHRSLGSLVDAMAERGAAHVDDALRVLHDLQQEVWSWPLSVPGRYAELGVFVTMSCLPQLHSVVGKHNLQTVLAAVDSGSCHWASLPARVAVMRHSTWRQTRERTLVHQVGLTARVVVSYLVPGLPSEPRGYRT